MLKKFSDAELLDQNEQKTRLPPQDGIRCSRCQQLVTDTAQRMDKNGAHRHTCTNPAQQTFNIGCFKEAPGCTHVGSATSNHTWFLGYSWRIAICSSCGTHLGWMFISSGDCFHGLILDALVED